MMGEDGVEVGVGPLRLPLTDPRLHKTTHTSCCSIDIDSSSHVLVEDSSIDTADDGVCIKGSTPGGQVVNVTVRNCRVRSRSSAIKFGSKYGRARGGRGGT